MVHGQRAPWAHVGALPCFLCIIIYSHSSIPAPLGILQCLVHFFHFLYFSDERKFEQIVLVPRKFAELRGSSSYKSPVCNFCPSFIALLSFSS